MKIVFVGGGTMGSVTPLLAAAERLHTHTLFFVGTQNGPEKKIVEALKIPYTAIVAAKLRRYISIYHVAVPFQLFVGVIQSSFFLHRTRPDVVVSAGGFVAVPLVFVAWLFRIPTIIHQQDILPGLANRLMKPFARVVTVAFEKSLLSFPQGQWIGNPVRDMTPTTTFFTVDTNFPTVLIMGGGTGSRAINERVTPALCDVANVIHLTGVGRDGEMQSIDHPRYHRYTFLGDELKEALAQATIVVSRAGLGAITELATLAKPAIIIPMPQSHQENNARLLADHDAAIVMPEKDITGDDLTTAIVRLLDDTTRQQELSAHIASLFPPKSTDHFVEIILKTGR